MADIGDYWREHKEYARKKAQEPTVDDFEVGDLVTYTPWHAHGNRKHPDCEQGRVTSKNHVAVFVRFGNKKHSEACSPEQLK